MLILLSGDAQITLQTLKHKSSTDTGLHKNREKSRCAAQYLLAGTAGAAGGPMLGVGPA